MIIGCGPAGATTAYLLASAGIQVTVLDKCRFPRPKLCGGLLTQKTLELLSRIYGEGRPPLQNKDIYRTISPTYELCYGQKQLCHSSSSAPFYFVDRAAYDHYLLCRARDVGANIVEGVRVKSIDIDNNEIQIAGGERMSADCVIGADGVNSVIRRSVPEFMPDSDKWRDNLAVTLECFLPHKRVPKQIGHPIVFFGYTNWGYAWAFPRGSEVALGIGSLIRRNAQDIKEQFAALLKGLNVELHPPIRIKGHLVPYGYHLEVPALKKCLLVGDAAGLVDCLYGEGIFFAHYSGYLAAKAILSCTENPANAKKKYIQLLHQHIFPGLKKRRRQRRLLFRSMEMFGHYPVKAFLLFREKWLIQDIHGSLSRFGDTKQ